MKTARRITRNFLSLSVSEVIAKLLQLVIFIYIARVFGETEFGKFSFALAFAFIIAIIADFGLNMLLIREISRNKDKVKKYMSNALGIKIFLSVLAVLVSYFYLNFMDYSSNIKSITYIMVLFAILQSFTDLFYSAFRAFERMHYDATMKVLRMFILSLFIFVIMIKNQSIVIIASLFVATEAIILFISLIIFMKKISSLSIELDSKFSKNLLKKSSFFGLSLVFSMFLLFIDSVMIQNFRGSAEVGIYTAAFNILLGITFIPLMFSNAVYPVFSRYFIDDKSLLKFAFRKSYEYILILGLPISIGIFVYASNIKNLIYGTGYSETIIAFKVLSFFVFLSFITLIPGTVLSAINKQRSRMFIQGTIAGVNIIFNLILIPIYGFVGAGIATVLSEILFFILYFYFVRKYGFGFKIVRSSLKPILASLLMTAIIINITNLFVGTIIGAISYFGFLFILRVFDKEDKTLLMRVIKNY
jgi:O-antigen/teichoic acid export membrane protein